MEIKETPDGKQRTFSIRFEKKSGELVFLPRAVATGLKMDMTKNRMRGVVPVDKDLNRTGHIYPVNIDNIYEFDGHPVVL